MSTTPGGERFCDTCGKVMLKAHRIYGGREYCGTCYKREFKALACTDCRATWRVHRRERVRPPCPACARRVRTCARCGGPAREIGCLVAGQPMCPSCAPHFSESQPCAWCGVESKRLSRAPALNVQDRICPRCRSGLTHRTCATCRRYRPVAGATAAGKPICKACQPDAQIFHLCPDCGQSQPGSGHGRCRSCVVKAGLTRLVQAFREGFIQPWTGDCMAAYAQWLHDRDPEHPLAVRRFQKHHAFFRLLDSTFARREDITSERLLAIMSVAELRSVLLAMRFLKQHYGISVSPADKERSAEAGRIAALLERSTGEPWGTILQGYAQALASQGGQLRTQRAYLSTAEMFARTVALTTAQPWTEQDLRTHLQRHPGCRANLFRFVTYCRDVLGWTVAIPSRQASGLSRPRPPSTVRRLSTALAKVAAVGVERAPIIVLAGVLAKAFGFSLADFSRRPWVLASDPTGLTLSHAGEQMTIPETLRAIALAWWHHRDRVPVSL